MAQWTEDHRHELIPAGEFAGMTLLWVAAESLFRGWTGARWRRWLKMLYPHEGVSVLDEQSRLSRNRRLTPPGPEQASSPSGLQ